MSQPVLSVLSQMVSIAYQAHQQNSPDFVTVIRSQALVLGFTLTNINPIFVFEGPLFERSVFFGFTATVAANKILSAINVIALRGTVTDYEFAVSFEDWNRPLTACILPTNGKAPVSRGNVQPAYWTFYQEIRGPRVEQSSLAQSMQKAITATKSGPDAAKEWFGTGHSLGGAMINLGVFDAFLAGVVTNPNNILPGIVTFGSVVLGDQAFASTYKTYVSNNNSWRVANLSDMIPSWRGLMDTQYSQSYKHVGIGYLFVWQTDSNWGNHSLANVYIAVATSPTLYKNIYIDSPPVLYPVSIVKLGVSKDASEVEKAIVAIQNKVSGTVKVTHVECIEDDS